MSPLWILIALTLIAVLIAFGPWFKSYRTMIFGTLSGLITAGLPLLSEVFAYLKDLDWREYVTAEKAPWVILAITVLFMVLRFRTKGAVGAGQ